MKAKQIFALVLAAVLVLSLLTGCGGQQAPAASGSTASASAGSGEPVHVTFWHAMNTDVITNIVDEFNQSQDEVYVECIYQGSYGDVLNNFRMAMAAGGQDAPDIVQVYEGGSAFMIESGYADVRGYGVL